MKAWQWVLLAIGAVVLSFVLVVWAFGLEWVGLSFQKPLENKRTGVTRSTNQYVTTQQQLLLTYAKEYEAAVADGNEAQADAIYNQIQSVAATLDPQYIPESAARILATHQ